jgi:AcrR family transcriptional regulator
MATSTRSQRLPADERRATILAAAGPLFARDGYAATRIDEIAAAAGVTKPIIYRHFASKKALYSALLIKHRDDLPTFVEPVDPAAPSDEASIAILEHWLDYVRANRHAWGMIFRDSSGDEEIRALRADVNVRAREVLAGFISDHGGAGIPSEQVEPTAELLSSGLAGMVLWWIDHPEGPKPVIVAVAARIIAAAIGGATQNSGAV